MQPMDFPQPLETVVFEMVEIEFFVAGIATSILDGDAVPSDTRRRLRQLELPDGQWLTRDGESIRMESNEDIRRYAEQLRKVCDLCVVLLSN
jgi:hypothetical protein